MIKITIMKIIECSKFREFESLDDILLNKLRGGGYLVKPGNESGNEPGDEPDLDGNCPANTIGCVLGGGGGGGSVPGGCYGVAACTTFGPDVEAAE